jgi:hypothetical protein
MADAFAFLLLYIVIFACWLYLAVVLSLVISNAQWRLYRTPRRADRTRDLWPDANCFFPWRLWW